MLLNKARAGEIQGFAFVAQKITGPCTGVFCIPDDQTAIRAAEKLIDAINGDTTFVLPIEN